MKISCVMAPTPLTRTKVESFFNKPYFNQHTALSNTKKQEIDHYIYQTTKSLYTLKINIKTQTPN